jgi:hypothetical protein
MNKDRKCKDDRSAERNNREDRRSCSKKYRMGYFEEDIRDCQRQAFAERYEYQAIYGRPNSIDAVPPVPLSGCPEKPDYKALRVSA